MKIEGKWVPREPTEEMLEAALDAWDRPTSAKPHETYPYQRTIYRAMLAAAPKPDLDAMVVDLGREIYDAMYASQGGIWAANESKDVWYGYARAVLRHLFGEG